MGLENIGYFTGKIVSLVGSDPDFLFGVRGIVGMVTIEDVLALLSVHRGKDGSLLFCQCQPLGSCFGDILKRFRHVLRIHPTLLKTYDTLKSAPYGK